MRFRGVGLGKRCVLIAALVLSLLAAPGVAYVLYQRGHLRFNYPSRREYPVRGIDVSHHQGPVDWSAVRRAGMDFALIKASEGADHRDRAFQRNWERARRAGLARGAYHFFTFCSSGQAQADNFIAALGGSFGELPPAADVEFSGNCRRWESTERIRDELRTFLARVEEAGRRRPVLYFTAKAHVRLLRGHFASYAGWPRNVLVEPSDSRTGRWLFWQFADNGRVAGVPVLVDLNVFRGGRVEFEALVGDRAMSDGR